MDRTSAIALGTVVIVLGLALVAADASSAQSDARLLTIGASLCLGGIVRVMTAFSMDSVTRQRAQISNMDPTDPRWRGGSGEVQIAGKKCVECGRRITVAQEGLACDFCHEPAHMKCADQHKAHKHRPEGIGIGPFR